MIYLASQSARRKEILKKLRIPFRIVESAYEEINPEGMAPGILTILHALGKVRLAQVPESAEIILGCDTVVSCQDKILGKPKNEKEAREMLGMLSGRKHSVYSGLVLWNRKTGKFLKEFDKTDVIFKRLSDLEIRSYIKRINPYDKAGGYAIQEKPFIVKKIKGSYSNVVGLPVELLIKLIKKMDRF